MAWILILGSECWSENSELWKPDPESALPVELDLSVVAESEKKKTSKGVTAAKNKKLSNLNCEDYSYQNIFKIFKSTMQENLDTQASSNLQVTTPFVVDFASLSKALPQYLLAPLSFIPVSPPFNVEKCLKNLGGNSPGLLKNPVRTTAWKDKTDQDFIDRTKRGIFDSNFP